MPGVAKRDAALVSAPRRSGWKYAGALALLTALTACVAPQPSRPATGVWQLDTVEGRELVVEPVTVTLGEASVAAFLGCNELTGTAQFGNGRFSVVDSKVTEKGCEPFAEVSAQERWLIEFLTSGVSTSELSSQTWVLKENSVTLKFRPSP